MLPASGGLFDLDALDESIAENEQKMAEPGFWDDNVAAQKVINANIHDETRFHQALMELGSIVQNKENISENQKLIIYDLIARLQNSLSDKDRQKLIKKLIKKF